MSPLPEQEYITGWEGKRLHHSGKIVQFDNVVVLALKEEDPLGIVDVPMGRGYQKNFCERMQRAQATQGDSGGHWGLPQTPYPLT